MFRVSAAFCFAACLCILFTFIGGAAEGKNAMYYNREGQEQLKRGEYQKALFSFRNALRQNPDYSDAKAGLGKAYLNMKIYDQALKLFDSVLASDPSSSEALTGSGFIYIEKGNFEEALSCFQRALEISKENLEAKYGIALLYHSMGKNLWAERQIESVLAEAPYHFDTLMLLGAIRSREGRTEEAKEIISKAIDAGTESAAGYTRMAELFFRDYMLNPNSDSLNEAYVNLNTALGMEADNFRANALMGDMLFCTGRFAESAEFYKKASDVIPTPLISYKIGCSLDRAGGRDEALRWFLQNLKDAPSDEIGASRLEQFLVNRDYKIGHPANTMRSRDNLAMAQRRMDDKLSDEAILYLRRCLMLNPADRDCREALMQYYSALDYNRLYIDELKDLARLYPENALRDKLAAEIIKRRDRLYHREGYSSEPVVRNVPSVLVLDFVPENGVSPHIDAGMVMANDLTFAMQQLGRMEPVGIQKRPLVSGMRTDGDFFSDTMEKLTAKIKSGELPDIDFIVYGTYTENDNRLTERLSLMDLKKAMVITSFEVSNSGRGSEMRLSLRAAKRIFDKIPFQGQILKVKDDAVIVNLGLMDGISPNARLTIYKYSSGRTNRQIILNVKEADTYLCSAEPQRAGDLDVIDVHDEVVPLENRRSKLIGQRR